MFDSLINSASNEMIFKFAGLNPIYVGYIRWGRHEGWEKKRRKGKTEDFVFIEGNYERIITKVSVKYSPPTTCK
jgi:Recombinase